MNGRKKSGNKNQSKSVRKGSKKSGQKKKSYSYWLFKRSISQENNPEQSRIRTDELGENRAKLSSFLSYRSVLDESYSHQEVNIHELKEKLEEKSKKTRMNTFELGGDRTTFVYPIRILLYSKNQKEKFQIFNSRKSSLEIVKTSPYLIRFSQGSSKSVSFLYSELERVEKEPNKKIGTKKKNLKADKESLRLRFSFEGKRVLVVQLMSKRKYTQLFRDFQRYVDVKVSQPKEYNLGGISKNVGSGNSTTLFYKKEVMTWNGADIKNWLKMVRFQDPEDDEISSIYEYIDHMGLFPTRRRKNNSSFFRTGDGGDQTFRQNFNYRILAAHFQKVEKALENKKKKKKKKGEEVEGENEEEEEEEEKLPQTYLDALFHGREELLKTFKFEVEMMEDNAIDKNKPYFNYNYNAVLRKEVDQQYENEDEDEQLTLLELRNRLLVERRYFWSVVDCVDRILCCFLNRMGVEDWIDHLECKFEGVTEKRKLGTLRTMDNDAWMKWEKKLEIFNVANTVVLQELSYNVSIDYERFKSSQREEVLSKKYFKICDLIDEQKEIKVDTKELEMKRDIIGEKHKEENKSRKHIIGTRDEEVIFLINDNRRRRIQDDLARNLKALVKEKKMFEMGVKRVISLLPLREREESRLTVSGSLTRLGLRFSNFLGRRPKFAQFGLSHTSVTIVNLAINWFSNSLIMLEPILDEENKHKEEEKRLYQEIFAIEAGCPTLCFKGAWSVHEIIFKIAEFVVEANVEYKYQFMNVIGSRSEKNINCQELTEKLLRILEYTPYDSVVEVYVTQFVEKYASLETNKPKDTKNSRWLPLKNQQLFMSKFKNQILSFEKKRDKPTKVKSLKDIRDNRIYFNSRQEVCEFVIMLMEHYPDFLVDFGGVHELLKGFDRAFHILGERVKINPFSVEYYQQKKEKDKNEEVEEEEEEEEDGAGIKKK